MAKVVMFLLMCLLAAMAAVIFFGLTPQPVRATVGDPNAAQEQVENGRIVWPGNGIVGINADGSGQVKRLADTGEGYVSALAWSPRGTKIALARHRTFGRNADIYVMNADGSNMTNLTKGERGNNPAWSLDGTKIAFDRSGDVYTMNPDGSQQTKLTNSPAVDVDPTWSPDGTKIAFVSDRDGDQEIYVMAALPEDATNPSASPTTRSRMNAPLGRPMEPR